MDAYYYRIIEKSSGSIVFQGIIRNSEDTIYPKQDTCIEDLPYECEAHHFSHPNYYLEGWEIEVPIELCLQQKPK